MALQKKRIYSILLGVCITILGAFHLMSFSMNVNDNKVINSFAKKGINVTVDHMVLKEHSVRVIATEQKVTDSTLFVFVHGAPGSWDAFKKYMMDPDILDQGRLVSYDRPGYGKSSKQSMINISDQADVLAKIIEQYKLPHVVVIGHSYGGPVVGNIAARFPAMIDKAVMIAPLNDPDSEPIFWFSYFAKWKLTKWILPNGFRVAGDEKFSHSTELSKMKELWSQITVPILHIHGSKDGLAPSKPNIAWSHKNINADVLQMEICEGEGHLVLWQAFHKVKSLILDFV